MAQIVSKPLFVLSLESRACGRLDTTDDRLHLCFAVRGMRLGWGNRFSVRPVCLSRPFKPSA